MIVEKRKKPRANDDGSSPEDRKKEPVPEIIPYYNPRKAAFDDAELTRRSTAQNNELAADGRLE